MLVPTKVIWFLLLFGFILNKNCLGFQQFERNFNTRIVGGTLANISQFPYQVSIQFNKQHFCGGTLITPNTVLTAAHCFGKSYTTISKFYQVNVGSNTTSGIAISIKSVLVHPYYSSETIDSDICLITLASNATLSRTISLINVSETTNYTWGTYGVVSGWGYESENGSVSTLLRSAEVPLVSPLNCQNSYDNIINITTNMLCAGFKEGGKDACQGDSGGPLVQNNTLIGIVSFGLGCARPGYPGVYTNVANLIKWIKDNSDYGGRRNTTEGTANETSSTTVSLVSNTNVSSITSSEGVGLNSARTYGPLCKLFFILTFLLAFFS